MSSAEPVLDGDRGSGAWADELTDALVDLLPQLLQEVARLTGSRTPRFGKRKTDSLRAQVRQHLRDLAPLFMSLGATSSEGGVAAIDVLGVFDDVIRSQLRLAGIRVSAGQRAIDVLMTRQERLLKPRSAKCPPLDTAREVVAKIVGDFAHPKHGPSVANVLKQFVGSGGHHETAAFLRALPHVLARGRHTFPSRVTERFCTQLADEYRFSAGFVEQRLRFLCALYREAEGKGKAWAEWKKEKLNNLISIAGTDAHLRLVADYIDRAVRNALAHGTPAANFDDQTISFTDIRDSVTWSFGEFFERTKSLTCVAIALSTFEGQIQLAQLRALIDRAGSSTPARRRAGKSRPSRSHTTHVGARRRSKAKQARH